MAPVDNADENILSLAALSAGAMTMFHEPLLRSAIVHLRPALGKNSILLDLGCGYGTVAAAMSGEGLALTGLDRDPEAVRYAQKRCPDVRYLLADAHNIPFATGSIDALLSLSVLQYVDWRRVIAECHRVLRIGGRAVFIENLRGNPLVAFYRLLRRVAWLVPSFPGLRRMTVDKVPLEHIAWRERHEFADVFGWAEPTAHYLTSPLALVQTSLFGSLAALDRRLLGARSSLAERAWIMTVKVTKRGGGCNRDPSLGESGSPRPAPLGRPDEAPQDPFRSGTDRDRWRRIDLRGFRLFAGSPSQRRDRKQDHERLGAFPHYRPEIANRQCK